MIDALDDLKRNLRALAAPLIGAVLIPVLERVNRLAERLGL